MSQFEIILLVVVLLLIWGCTSLYTQLRKAEAEARALREELALRIDRERRP